MSERVPVESIIACLCMSRFKDKLDCELEVTTGNDFDYGQSMTCASCTCTPCTFMSIQCCRDNDRITSMHTCRLLVSVTLSCSTKSHSLSSWASKHIVSRKIRSCFMEKGVRMFVRQSRPSCRQEKLSTICLQVVYKLSTNKYLRYYLQIESCQTVPAFDLLVHSLVEVTCNPFNDVLTMIASVSMNTCHLLSVCRSLAIRKQTHCQT